MSMVAGSLQRRLGLGLTLGVTVLWLAATLASGLVLRHELDEAFDSALEETAQRILPLAVTEIVNREQPALPQQIAVLRPHKELLSYLIRDANGTVLLQSHDVDPALFAARPSRGFRTQADYRIYGESAVSDTIFIEVVEPLVHRRNATRDAIVALIFPLVLLIPISLLGIWLLVRLSLGSVLAYKDAIAARGAGDLSPITMARLPTEIEPVAQAVDQLMQRLRRALESERSFTANSAHELRTPLATVLAQVQRLRREAPSGPLQERAAQIETSLRRLVRLSEKLMQLAKAEGGDLMPGEPCDVVPVLQHVVDEFRRASDGRVTLQLTVPEQMPIPVVIDADAFAILVRNLVENALKYGDARQAVTISLSTTGVLRVINGGPVVDAATLAGLKTRFVRAVSFKAGAGLGLAIVDAIARGVGGSLTLHSPALGRTDGFEAVVQLPDDGSSI